jgi:hypothetical protein
LYPESPVITFACPHCLKTYAVSDHKAGLKTRCKKCRGPLVVPPAPEPVLAPWKADPALASAGTAERAKTPTDADLVLPPLPVDGAPSVAEIADLVRAPRFVVQLEYAGDPGPVTDDTVALFEEARHFLADVLYAYRHRLAPKGARLTKVVVDGVEREV